MQMFTRKRIAILIGVAIAGWILGRVAVRAGLDLLLGGTLTGGDWL